MQITEIRDLDGPNIFLRSPAIKVEVETGDDGIALSPFARECASGDGPEALLTALEATVRLLHERAGQPVPETATRVMEAPGHYVVAFTWSHRRFAEALGRLAADLVIGERDDVDAGVRELETILASSPEPDDAPEMVSNAERTIPCVAITGTNGKTTTSRLISFIVRQTGKTVGLTSSAGVYIDGEQVIAGDYSGPAGAHRVFEDERVEVAVLETARGGILLRGLGYEESDVSVVTNISADHLGLHGVYSIENLADVKATVPRMTREGGFAVLNADDPLVLGMREGLRSRPFLVTQQPVNAEVGRHIGEGGWALTLEDGTVVWWHDGQRDEVTTLDRIPMTFGGRATHMVENALCATGACLALGLRVPEVRDGLAAFRSSSRDNHGRLNVYTLDGGTVVLDFAHNEVGLSKLLDFSTHFREGDGTLTAIIGTAGDREDSVFLGLGRIAAERADRVVRKDTERYLRGRVLGEMPRLLQQGVDSAGTGVESLEAPSEREACLAAFENIRPGDVIAVMCIEDYDFLLDHLDTHGRSLS